MRNSKGIQRWMRDLYVVILLRYLIPFTVHSVWSQLSSYPSEDLNIEAATLLFGYLRLRRTLQEG